MSDPKDSRGQVDLFDLPLGLPSDDDRDDLLPEEVLPEEPRSAPTRPPETSRRESPQPGSLRRESQPELPQRSPSPSSHRNQPVPSQSSASSTTPLLPAGLGRRLLSGVADLLVHAGALATAVLGLDLMGIELDVAHALPLALLILSFSYLYTVISLSFWGQTAGMAWLGIAARQSPQFPLSFRQSTIRWMGGLLTFGLAGLPLLLTLTGGSLTDRMSESQSYADFFEAA